MLRKSPLLFQLQIYTLFESNSQLIRNLSRFVPGCFNCKYTHYSKAIHNTEEIPNNLIDVVSTANIHIIRKQFTTRKKDDNHADELFQLQIYTLFESNSQPN